MTGTICVAIVIVTLVIVFIALYQRRHRNVSAPNLSWYVLPDFANAKEAAAMLDRMNSDVIHFLEHLRHKYRIDYTAEQGVATQLRLQSDQIEMISALLDGYNFETVYENRPKSAASTSYTIAKGESMYICLRDGQDHTQFVDYQVLLFVIIHELAHIANYDEYGHNDKFWTVFKFLLAEAEECGIYKPVNYAQAPVDYCKLHINYSPHFDTTLPILYPGRTTKK